MEDTDNRYYRLAGIVIVAYAGVVLIAGKLGWQHLGLLALGWACVAMKKGPRRFIHDWWPIVIFWLGYDSMRIFSDSLMARAALEAPFRWERVFFPSPTGTIWPFFFAAWREAHAGEPWTRAATAACNLVYLSHLVCVPLVLLTLWLRGRALLFRRLLWALAVINVSGLITYFAYPAAPPWWIFQNGFRQPTMQHSMPVAESGSVPLELFSFSANRFAAIPSLHAAYPLVLAMVLGVHRARRRSVALALLYALAMWFSCIFLNQHYIVDLIIGAMLVPLAVPAARRPPDHLMDRAVTRR
jgi:hypothetical protein